MSDNYHCPVEGCEFGDGEEKNKTQVRSHITSSKAESHDWEELKPLVEGQQNADHPPKEGEEAPDGDSDDYEEQWASATEGGESGDGDEDDGPDDEADDGSDTPSNGGLPTSWKLVGGVLIALIVVVLVVRARSEDGETDEEPASEPDEAGDVTAHDLISEDQ